MIKKKCAGALLAYAASMAKGVFGATNTLTIPQDMTNGKSLWGTQSAPVLPKYLHNGSSSSGEPWNSHKGEKFKPYSHPPETGVTRRYDFDVRRGILAPDGHETSGIFVNGQFPGPAIEANWGDWIEVTVHNNIQDSHGAKAEGTAMHFHGIRQKETPWFDGVPGVTQCPIAPGSSFTYRFRAVVYGTSWWHSHFSAQYTAGVWGPLIFYGPTHVDYDVDIGPVMLGDFYHREYSKVVDDAMSNSTDFTVYVPSSDNSLINGKNKYNCSMAADNATCRSDADLAEFRFQPGKTHRLRLMNTGAAALLHFSIDQHRMTVIANDFEPVVPYEADYITLHVGQRTDILVKADANPDLTYWMRSTISLNCSVSHSPEGRAIVGYKVPAAKNSPNSRDKHEGPLQIPNSTISPAAAKADEKSFLCRNDDLSRTVPFFPQAMNPKPDLVETIVVDLLTNGTGQHVWIMNNSTQRTDYNEPLLLDAYQAGNLSRFLNENPSQGNAYYEFGANKTIRIVLKTPYQSAHPMHLHGHVFQVLSEGVGDWDGHTIVNPQNPLRRDTHLQPRYGHLVIQFTTDNPGVWSYHCHIAWHASMGLNIMILEGGDYLKKDKVVPRVIDQTCVDWDKWTQQNTVDQVDAGI